MSYKRFHNWQTHVYSRILAMVPSIEAKNIQSTKKIMTNDVKPVSKPTNTRFWPYQGNGTFGGRKIPSKVVKKEQQIP